MTLRRLILDRGGASAAEFALVLPLVLLLIFGIIDAGRYMWSVNRAEKAAQMGVRMAVVTDAVSSAINANYIGACTPALGPGDPIPRDCFSSITCTGTATTATCTGGTANATAFQTILGRMQQLAPDIAPADVEIIYSPSGLGYAGDPSGPDLAPLVTVRLSGMDFAPMIFLALANIGLPEVRSSLTFEDGTGSVSN